MASLFMNMIMQSFIPLIIQIFLSLFTGGTATTQ